MLDSCNKKTKKQQVQSVLNTVLRLISSLWAILLPTMTKSLLQCNKLLQRLRGTHMLPIQVFVTAIKAFDWQKLVNHLIVPFWGSWVLDLQSVKGQIAEVCSWSIDFSSSEVTLILWSPPKMGLDCLVQFWFGRKCFYTGRITGRTCNTKVPVRRDSSCFVHYYGKL